jgi:hypothetical protein
MKERLMTRFRRSSMPVRFIAQQTVRGSLRRLRLLTAWLAVFATGATDSLAEDGAPCVIRVSVTTPLTFPRVPFDPEIDFGTQIRNAGLSGVLDPNSVSVIDVAGKVAVPFGMSEQFAHGDRGRLEWVIDDPSHTVYDVHFRIVPKRPALRPARSIPHVGVGDLLRYNAGVPRPVALPYLSRLVDLTGDGKPDLVGCWNYAYRPGQPWDGVVCYPREGSTDRFEFGELIRVRFATSETASEFRELSSIYMNAEFADLNGDGLPDVIYSPLRGEELELFLNSGRRDGGGMPDFAPAGKLLRPKGAWEACRAADLNGDGAVDLIVGDMYLQNTNMRGWPIEPAPPVRLDAGTRACFLDLDGDGRLDAVCLLESKQPGPPQGARIGWKKNLGGDPPRFAPVEPLAEFKDLWCDDVAAVSDGDRRGVLVQHDIRQGVSFYELLPPQEARPHFRKFGRAESVSAVMSLSDQAWPCLCDWNNDGRLDLLVGGGYGWPRILLNEGTRTHPAWSEPAHILSEGEPIRVFMSQVFRGCDEYKHNMGYPFPDFVDWDGDGLSDLMLPNCTNRLFWYRNIGTRHEPRFGPRLQLNPVGYEDSPAKREQTGRILMARWEGELEPGQPFFWRTGAAFADFDGDGLTDLVTHDGETRKATLFAQRRDNGGNLQLHKIGPLKLSDGRLIDDSLVGRKRHWTESFRAADWDGDGRLDLVYSCAGSDAKGSIYLLRNVGTKQQPVFDPPRTLCCFGEPIFVTAHGPHPWVGDYDGDGKPDLLTCVEWSVYPFYSHAAIEMTERPKFELRLVP